MASTLIQQPDMGLDARVPSRDLDPRAAARGSENVFYENGVGHSPYGFSKVDLSTTGLNSGDTVLELFTWTELDNYVHEMAVTTQKIYDHDRVNDTWDDVSQTGTTYNSSIAVPISYAVIAHDDTAIYINDNAAQANAYYHVVVCDGGLSNIQRWAGRYETDFADVVGAGGYHDGTTHRALHVGECRSRLILLNAQEYSSSSKLWVDKSQRVRWPAIAKLETWSGTGSGYADLIDTGGHNLWAAKLGGDYVVYQNNSIWTLNYVGGTVIFDPRPAILDLGLLASKLIATKNNIHYFIGNDYNVYSYLGGSVYRKIGDSIHKFLQDDLDTTYYNRCRMVFGPENKRLWIFIVPSGSVYPRKAYVMDVRSGAWQVRDFAHVFGSSTGVTAVTLATGGTYISGDSYAEALDTLSGYDAADDTATTAGDTTVRYGDVLFDSTNNFLDWSSLSAVADYDFHGAASLYAFSAGGLKFCFSYENDPTKLVGDDTDYSNLVVRVDDGSDSDKIPNGSHYYTLTDICSVLDAGADYTVTAYVQPCESTGTGIADTSSDTPTWAADTSMNIIDPSGTTYRQAINEIESKAALFMGDASGFVYRFDATVTTDDGEDIISRHRTPVLDMDKPDLMKRWEKVSVVAASEMTSDGATQVFYRTTSFDTSTTGWSDYTKDVHDVTVDATEFDIYINETSKNLQLEFRDWSGSNWKLLSYEIYGELLSDR